MLEQHVFTLTMEMPCSFETSLIFNYKTTSCENSKDINLNFLLLLLSLLLLLLLSLLLLLPRLLLLLLRIIIIIIIIRPDEIITAPAVPC